MARHVSGNLTPYEKKALEQLDNAMKVLSKNHWFFMSEDGLQIMKYNENGDRALTPSGGVDQEYIVACIVGYETDAGGW